MYPGAIGPDLAAWSGSGCRGGMHSLASGGAWRIETPRHPARRGDQLAGAGLLPGTARACAPQLHGRPGGERGDLRGPAPGAAGHHARDQQPPAHGGRVERGQREQPGHGLPAGRPSVGSASDPVRGGGPGRQGPQLHRLEAGWRGRPRGRPGSARPHRGGDPHLRAQRRAAAGGGQGMAPARWARARTARAQCGGGRSARPVPGPADRRPRPRLRPPGYRRPDRPRHGCPGHRRCAGQERG